MAFVFSFTVILFAAFYAIFFVANNVFVAVIYLEFSSLCVCLLLVAHSALIGELYFELWAIALMAIAGAESAIAISLLVAMNRLGVALSAREFSNLVSLLTPKLPLRYTCIR